jgi:acyl-CoA reductase-like NAD-dependent aldehyde dehydrogenase
VTTQQRVVGLHIGGEAVYGERRFAVQNRFTGEAVAEVTEATAADVGRAVAAAAETFARDQLTPQDRATVLRRAAELAEHRSEDIARVMATEAGITIKDARGEITRAVQTLIIASEEAKRVVGHMVPIQAAPGLENRLAFTIRTPVGVVGAITPFNAPFNGVCHKVGPAVAAGNTVVLKPAPATPLTALQAVQLFEDAGLPAGYVNVVFGGAAVGAALLADQRVGFYTFTGSAHVGEIIKRNSGLRRVQLELGNNSATIVCEDAVLERAAPLLVRGGYRKAGQVCVSVQRVYAHEAIADQLAEAMKGEIARLKVGDPLDPETDVGPLISEQKAIELEEWIQRAVEAGARLVCGGRRDGVLLEPTLLAEGLQSMQVVCEEVFGPVITIVPFTELDQAIDWVNDSPYGLQAGIFTQDIDRAMRAARRIRVGGLHVNDTSNARGDMMPYGGVKNSGIGREGPYYAIREMTDERVVVLNLRP